MNANSAVSWVQHSRGGGVSSRRPTSGPVCLYGLERADLERFVHELGEPRYRADQLWQWLYTHFVASFDEMTNLPLSLRRRLAAEARLHTLQPVAITPSADGLAEKFLFRLADGQLIETVLMHYIDPADDTDATDGTAADPTVADPTAAAPAAADPTAAAPAAADPAATDSAATDARGRHTVCLSTQAGCAMGCVFCATGQMGLVRDLTAAECIEQLVMCGRVLHRTGQRIGNVVFMGMGEPLANWPATWQTVERLHDPAGFGLGARRITISTVGIVPGIRRLAEAPIPVRLAVSLHAPDEELRRRLVPIERTYDLADILAACRDYQRSGGRRITFEYVLIDGVNDAPDQAHELARRLAGLNAHVNLIPLNPTAGSPLLPSPYRRAVKFQAGLRAAGIPTTLRMRRGIEIDAGCGQLRSRAVEGRIGRTLRPPALEPRQRQT